MDCHLRSVVRGPIPMNDHTSRMSEAEQLVRRHEPIREMLEGLSLCSPGPDDFSTLWQEPARPLDADFAFSAKIAGEAPLRSGTVARFVDNSHVANPTSRLAGPL